MNSVVPADRCTDRQRSMTRLACFVIASVVLHTLLVVLWRAEPPAGAVGRGSLQITLQAPQGESRGDAEGRAGSQPGPAMAQSSEAGQLADRREKLRAAAVVASAQPTAPAVTGPRQPAAQLHSSPSDGDQQRRRAVAAEQHDETHVANDQAGGSASSGLATAGRDRLSSDGRYRRVRAALQEALLPRFDYPSLARRRGWQGRVRVGLHVEANGELSRIRLLESSGYSLLDKAAVKNVTELRKVPAVIQWLDGRDIDVILPVRYQLKNR
jgi:protein TonB